MIIFWQYKQQAACDNIRWTPGTSEQVLQPSVLFYNMSNELSVVNTFYSCYSTCDVNGEMHADDDNNDIDDGNPVFYLCTVKIHLSNYVQNLLPRSET